MNNKLTKEQMLSELMIKLETIDGKLDKLLNSDLRVVMNVSVVGDTDPNSVTEQIKNTLSDLYGHKPFSCPDVTPHCIDRTRPCKCSGVMTNQEFDEEMK